MPIQLPQFSHRQLTYLSLCAAFPSDSASLAALIPKKDVQELESCYKSNGEVTYLHLVANRFPDDSFHLHVDIASEGFFDGDPPEPKTDLNDLLVRLNEFSGHTARLVMLRGHVTVEIEDLPKRGLALGLRGIETVVGGEMLELVGATFSISGQPFDRLKWKVDDEDSISATIFASLRNHEINECYLENGVQTAITGIDKFLIEKQHELRFN